jgi:hypothetical protein
MKEVSVETIGDYLSVIKQHIRDYQPGNVLQDVIFRGQSGDYPLMPKICRLKSKEDLLQTEKQILEEFKRSNPLHFRFSPNWKDCAATCNGGSLNE